MARGNETYIVIINGGVVQQVIERLGPRAEDTVVLNEHQELVDAMQRLNDTSIGGRGIYSDDGQ